MQILQQARQSLWKDSAHGRGTPKGSSHSACQLCWMARYLELSEHASRLWMAGQRVRLLHSIDSELRALLIKGALLDFGKHHTGGLHASIEGTERAWCLCCPAIADLRAWRFREPSQAHRLAADCSCQSVHAYGTCTPCPPGRLTDRCVHENLADLFTACLFESFDQTAVLHPTW